MAKKKTDIEARVLSPNEYPTSITARQGAYTPKIMFAAQHPLGLYHVQDEGIVGNPAYRAYFTPKRKGSKAKSIGFGGGSMPGALRRISQHEDEAIHPEAAREMGTSGPVSIYALGKRTGEPKPKSQLDQELDTWLAQHGYT